ncbi:MAG: hypothetical protein ACJAQT_002763 [Akkermansiaceae bacterium]|jgi:hypothetical protein
MTFLKTHLHFTLALFLSAGTRAALYLGQGTMSGEPSATSILLQTRLTSFQKAISPNDLIVRQEQTGLKSGTLYHYRAHFGDSKTSAKPGVTGTFKTLPVPEKESEVTFIDFLQHVPVFWSKDDHDFRCNDSDHRKDRLPLPHTGIDLFREQLLISPQPTGGFLILTPAAQVAKTKLQKVITTMIQPPISDSAKIEVDAFGNSIEK